MNLDACPSTASPLVVPEVVTCAEEVDIGNATRLGADLITAMRPGVPVVIADMTLTQFCDSSGIRHLLLARDYAGENGIELRVVIPSAAVRRTLQVLGADQVLRIYPSLQAALTGGSGGSRPASS